jgi:hypothetical protein
MINTSRMMTERPVAADKGSSSRRPHQQHGASAAADDPAALKQQIYSQLKRSGVVASLKVNYDTVLE